MARMELWRGYVEGLSRDLDEAKARLDTMEEDSMNLEARLVRRVFKLERGIFWNRVTIAVIALYIIAVNVYNVMTYTTPGAP